jgi:hypothetical protein
MLSTLNKSLLPSSINISLKEERLAIDFNQEQLAHFIWGNEANLKRHRTLQEHVANDPILKNDHFMYDLTREEYIEKMYQKIARVYSSKIEELSYKNIFYWILLIGTVRIVCNYIYVGPHCSSSCHV